MNNNYENKILDAIQTLVDNAVNKAGYDKTIKAVISKCVNESTGKYVVKYQDSTFYAYSNDLDSVYSGGTPVYVLVPGNDMSQTKTILGSVDKLGTEYITISESDSAYQEIGSSIVTPAGEIPGISSYRYHDGEHEDHVVIYDADAATGNTVDVDEEGAVIYFQNAQYLEIGGTFTTRLNEEQKRKGNYGLVFDIEYKYDNENDPNNPTIRTQTYVLDINSMTGNPYSYNFGSEQNAIFEIDGEHLYRVKKITLECKNFPKYSSPYTDDIFVSDIILKALTPLTRDEIATNSLTFITKQGVYFSASETGNPTRLIETEVKINRRVIPTSSGLLRYYWFKEDSSVGLTDPNYSPFGGPGWKILNPANIIDETNNIKDYITDVDSLTVDRNSNPAEENEYKCVVIYNNEIQVERNFIIYNQGSIYTVAVESDQGNYFKYNEGHPTLTCTVETSGTAPTYTYTWTVTDSFNRTSILAETTALNTAYETAVSERDALLAEKSGGVWTDAKEAQLVSKEATISYYDNNVMRIKGNKIYNVDLSGIANFSKYTCSVSSSGNFLGKDDIIITNSWDKEDNSYSIIMENADQIFKYNVNGIAPTNKSLDKPITIKPLQFSIYNELGQQVADNKIAAVDVTWYVPANNTMFKKPNPEPTIEDGYYVYTGVKTLNFDIIPVYNNKNMNNTIKLVVKYNDRVLVATSELEFIKEGEMGSNGTNYVCRIIPNLNTGAQSPSYPIYTYNGTSGDMNYVRPSGHTSEWFKVQLFKDGADIFTGVASGTSSENKAVTIEWSILKNRYATNNSVHIDDASNFNVNSSTGEFTFTNLSNTGDDPLQDRAANIAKVTVTYDGATYYATMPIILVKTTSTNYSMDVVENTGFRYVMYTTDGLNPAYDSSNPFALRVYKMNGTTKEDVSVATGDDAVVYDWFTLGKIYNGTTWVAESNFVEKAHGSSNPLAHNEKDYRPIEKFNGLSVNNAVKCIVSKGGTEWARIYLPVHFYLNRFGNAALNGWDGNHVEINENGGFILSPQIGAGTKDSNNRFTGIFMGSVKEAGASSEEVGLFGYNAGERTIALDSQDGSAKFGKTGDGQIVIDPGNDSARLYSGDFAITSVLPGQMVPAQTTYQEGFRYIRVRGDNVTLLKLRPAGTTPLADDEYRIGDSFKAGDRVWVSGDGLEIDLNDPHIIFGNGNFRVDSDGQVYATGFVTVKELEAGDYNIPGTNIFDVEYATNIVQFETNAQLYPLHDETKSIICKCKYKEQYTDNYTVNLIDDNGNVIQYHDAEHMGNNWDGIDISITKQGQVTTIGFTVDIDCDIASTILSYRFRFTYPTGLIVDKIFNVNLVVKGTSIAVKGSFNSTTEMLNAVIAGTITPALGDSYIIDRDLWIYTNDTGHGGTVIGDWYDAGEFQGEPGQDGQPGQDAKQLYLASTAEAFKTTDGSTYTPSTITITPFFQNTTFNKWQYSTNGGSSFTDLNLSSLPAGITYNSNTKAITVTSGCSLYTSSISVLVFKCVANEEYDTTNHLPYWDSATIARIKDGEKGSDGRTIWVTPDDPTISDNRYVFLIDDLVGPNKTPEIGEIIILDNRFQYSIAEVTSTTVIADEEYDMRGPAGAAGNNTAIVNLYTRAASTPSVPYSGSGSTSYTFDTQTLANIPQGWSQTIPAAVSDTSLYVSSAMAYGNTNVVSIENDDWSTPALVSENGINGTSPFLAYLTNEVQMFAAEVGSVEVNTDLYAYEGDTQKTVQIKKVGNVNASTSYVTTSPSWLEFKVSSTSSVNHPTITFRTRTGDNLPPQAQSGQIAIEYLVSGESNNRIIYFTYSTTTKGANAIGLNIEPSGSLFKSTDGGTTYSPSTIELRPNLQNTTFGSWYYRGIQITNTGSGSSTNVDGVSLNSSTKVLTISPSSTEFNTYPSLTFEARDSSGTAKDSATVTKIADPMNTFIRYSAYPDGHDMSDNPQGKSYIGVYNGTSTIAPTNYQDYSWSKYIGETGNGINDITYKYKATNTQTAPSASETGWVNDISSTTFSATNKYLWQKEVIDYTLITDKTTVALIAVYGDKGADTYNIILSNEAQTIDADTTKATPGRSYYTDIIGYMGTTLQTLSVTTPTSQHGLPTGMSASVSDNNTDHPRVTFTIELNTDMTTKSGQITIPVTINSQTINKTFSYALAIKGTQGNDGDDGYNTATISLYTRSASAPSKPYSSGSVTYTFATQQLSGTIPSGWSYTVPNGSNPLYVSSVSVTSNTATATIGYDDWSTPTKVAQDGESGEDAINLTIEAVGNTVFRNSQGSVTLIAHVYKGGVEQTITSQGVCGTLGNVNWYLNGTLYQTTNQITISPSNINDLAYITCKLEY